MEPNDWLKLRGHLSTIAPGLSMARLHPAVRARLTKVSDADCFLLKVGITPRAVIIAEGCERLVERVDKRIFVESLRVLSVKETGVNEAEVDIKTDARIQRQSTVHTSHLRSQFSHSQLHFQASRFQAEHL